ncbi:hypothetical protein [Streptomyces sp. 147326]|uniref:hypothetical protein n=1 Tax=Streptomyces sp. 147326 TaxID=3074379 RepID=UPI003857E582
MAAVAISKLKRTKLIADPKPVLGGTYLGVVVTTGATPGGAGAPVTTAEDTVSFLDVGHLAPLQNPDGLQEFASIIGSDSDPVFSPRHDMLIEPLLPGNAMDSRLVVVDRSGGWDQLSDPFQTLQRKVAIDLTRVIFTNIDEAAPGQVRFTCTFAEGGDTLGYFDSKLFIVEKEKGADEALSYQVISGPKAIDAQSLVVAIYVQALEEDDIFNPDDGSYSPLVAMDIPFGKGGKVANRPGSVKTAESGGLFAIEVEYELSVTYM